MQGNRNLYTWQGTKAPQQRMDLNAMDINILDINRIMDEQSRERYFSQKKCYACRQIGHIA